MILDTATLLVVLVFVSALLSALLAVSWLQNRAVSALAWWSVAFALGTVGAALLAGRGRIPDLLSIDLANAVTLLAYGLAWNSARRFDQRRARPCIAVAGALVWLIACRVPAFHDSYLLRLALASSLLAAYIGAAGWELWRGARQLPTRRLAALVLAGHAAVLLLRAPLAFLTAAGPQAEGLAVLAGPLNAALVFEALVFTVSTAFLLLSTAKEQLEVEHRRAALEDPLTGLANRRGFFAGAKTLIEYGHATGRPAALLVIDIDFFKVVNDTYGHKAGDRVLQCFSTLLRSEMRGGDLIARIGGEEFAVALPNTNVHEALQIAERIRVSTERLRVPVSGKAIAVTVSIGVAASQGAETLDAALSSADAALYRSKRAGRNIVRSAERGRAERLYPELLPPTERLSA
jgi:diguanylate cyclase (GGDEF)-like protein